MSTPEGLAFEPFVDDGGNIGIRLNQEVFVYTPEEQAQIRAEFERLATENAKLRELLVETYEAITSDSAGMFHKLIAASMRDDLRELGVEVDG